MGEVEYPMTSTTEAMLWLPLALALGFCRLKLRPWEGGRKRDLLKLFEIIPREDSLAELIPPLDNALRRQGGSTVGRRSTLTKGLSSVASQQMPDITPLAGSIEKL
jgi:hypothetical protein